MKTWFIYEITNWLGNTERISVWANNNYEAKEKLEKELKYPPKELKYIGNSCYNPREDVGRKCFYGMSAVDIGIAYGLGNMLINLKYTKK